MLKELLRNKEFLKIIKQFLEKPEVLDILLFGSLVRGKEKPRDIDLLIIYANKAKDIIKINYELRKELEKISKNIEVTGREYSELFKPEFLARESLLAEGFSLKQGKFFSEALGYKNFMLFKYSLSNLDKSTRMRFYYSLHGRGKEAGLLKKTKCHKFSSSIILSPIENSEVIKDFLEKWALAYIEMPMLIPERIVKYKFKAP